MAEIALVVMAVLLAGAAFALGFFAGFYGSGRRVARWFLEAAKAEGLPKEVIERIVAKLGTAP